MTRTGLIVLIAILFPFLSLSYGQSQPSAPTPAISREVPQHKSSTERTNTNTKENSTTQKLPAPVVPEIRKDEASEVKDGQTSQKDKKPTFNWRSVIDSNLVIALFTGVLAISTILLWRSTRKQASLTYKSFIAANRPRLRIRHVHSDPAIVPVWVYVVNVGGSDATGIELHVVFTLKAGNCRQAPWIENLSKSVWHGPTKLVPGEEGTYELRSKPDVDVDGFGTSFDIASNGKTLSIIGKARYRDANKTERETGFGWIYDPGTGEFSKPEKDDQYNYED